MTADEEKQHALQVEQKQIDDAKTVREFLLDPVIAELLKKIEKKYLAEFGDADTDEKRRNVWACTKALTTFVEDLNATLDVGKFAQHARNTRTAAEDRQASRTPRK